MALNESSGFGGIFGTPAADSFMGAQDARNGLIMNLAQDTIRGTAELQARRAEAKRAAQERQRQSGGGFLGGLGSALGGIASVASFIPGLGLPAAAGGALIKGAGAIKKIG